MLVTAHLTWTDWYFEPTVTLGLLLVVALYVMAWRRGTLAGDDDVSAWLPSSRWRPWLFALGVLIAFLALASPLDEGGDRYLFSLHMIQHLLLMMVTPPLALLGICGARPLFEGGWPRLRVVARWVTRPWPALVIFNVVMLGWHWPPFYDTTLTVQPVHVFEHITFVLAGVIFWWPIVDPFRHADTVPVRPMTKIAMLVIGGIPPTILGFIFAMAPSGLYSFYVDAPRLWGISVVLDQQIGGVIMMGVGNLVYFVAVGTILLRLLSSEAGDEDEEVAPVSTRAVSHDAAQPAAAVVAAGWPTMEATITASDAPPGESERETA